MSEERDHDPQISQEFSLRERLESVRQDLATAIRVGWSQRSIAAAIDDWHHSQFAREQADAHYNDEALDRWEQEQAAENAFRLRNPDPNDIVLRRAELEQSGMEPEQIEQVIRREFRSQKEPTQAEWERDTAEQERKWEQSIKDWPDELDPHLDPLIRRSTPVADNQKTIALTSVNVQSAREDQQQTVTLDLTRQELFALMLSHQLDRQQNGPSLTPGVDQSIAQKLAAAETRILAQERGQTESQTLDQRPGRSLGL